MRNLLQHTGDLKMLDTFFLWISFGQPPQQGIPIFLSIIGLIILAIMLKLRKGTN